MDATRRIAGSITISRLLAMFLAVFALTGCQSGAPSIPMDYMAAYRRVNPADEPFYRETAMQFIRYAQAGDVQQMLAMSSSHTYATQSDSVRTVYAEQVVPRFQGVTVTWAPQAAPITDEERNPGLKFTGTVHGKKKFSFDVAVYREDGKLAVANIRAHH